MKKPFVTKELIEEVVKEYPTPFHIYDEKGIRENAKALKEAFSWNKGYKEFFAVKATPNPFLIDILREYGCGCDCSSMTELMLSHAMDVPGEDIMFSSNDTPAEEFAYAAKIGATINLDDITHIDFLEKTIGYLPKTLSCRYNPGGYFSIANSIMDNPGDAKYGFTTEQMFEGYKILKAKGVENFGIHAFLASNTVTNDYYPTLARELFELAVKLKEETGAHITFINLSGGMWNMSPEEWRNFGTKELIQMGILSSGAKIRLSHCEKVKKAYPAYFDTYAEMPKLRRWLDGIGNLYCIGRNGQHRYNNMDHSMLTAMTAVDCLFDEKKDRKAIWQVNTEKEYHEEG